MLTMLTVLKVRNTSWDGAPEAATVTALDICSELVGGGGGGARIEDSTSMSKLVSFLIYSSWMLKIPASKLCWIGRLPNG